MEARVVTFDLGVSVGPGRRVALPPLQAAAAGPHQAQPVDAAGRPHPAPEEVPTGEPARWGAEARSQRPGLSHPALMCQEGERRVKMQNMVRFPLMGMDMAPHVVKRSQSSWSLPSHWSPWRRPYGLGRNPNDYLYDLYAVCNHHGNMHGGHYTGSSSARRPGRRVRPC